MNRNLHATDSDRWCHHVEFSVDGTRVRYEAGDHLGIFPINDSRLVNRIAELLDVQLETVFKLINLDGLYLYNNLITISLILAIIQKKALSGIHFPVRVPIELL